MSKDRILVYELKLQREISVYVHSVTPGDRYFTVPSSFKTTSSKYSSF